MRMGRSTTRLTAGPQAGHRVAPFSCLLAGGSLVVTLLLAACGGGSPKTAATTTTTAADPAADRATAQAINLTAADMSGYQESANPDQAGGDEVQAKLDRCVGGPSPQSIQVVDVTSPNFDKGNLEVSSDVTMMKSHQDAVADDRSVESPKLDRCIQQVAGPVFSQDLPPGAKVTKISASLVRPTEHVPGLLGLQMTIDVSSTESGVTVTVPIYIRELGFVVGRAEVGLEEVQPTSPLAVPNEASLVSLLYSRAKQHAT